MINTTQQRRRRRRKTSVGNRGGSKTKKVDVAYAAIDLHSTTSVIGARCQGGEELCCWRFPTSGKELVEHVKAIRADELHVVIEETPMTHWAVGVLRGHCTSVMSCDPRHNRSVARNSFKGDEMDVDILSRMLRLGGELKEVFHTADEGRFAFKAAVQHYRDVQRDRVRAKNKVKAIMRRTGSHAESKPRSIFAQKNRAELLDLMPSAAWRRSLSRAFRHYDWLHAEAREALKEAVDMGRAYPEIEEFLKVPGVGPVGAHTYSAFIIEPSRFATRSSLHRYCGLAITDKSSDGKPLGYRRIERNAGCRELKDMSYHAWLAAISAKNDNEVKAYYHAALAANGGRTTWARLTTQRKIVAALWTVWRRGATYDPGRFIYGGGG